MKIIRTRYLELQMFLAILNTSRLVAAFLGVQNEEYVENKRLFPFLLFISSRVELASHSHEYRKNYKKIKW